MNQFSPTRTRSTIETILVLLLFLALLYALYDVLKVFFGVFTFALIFSVSFSRPFQHFAARLGNRRKLAAFIYALVLIALIALPFLYLIAAMGKHVKELLHWTAEVRQNGLPPLSEKISAMPLIGDYLANFWLHLQQSPKETLVGHEQELKIALHHLLTGGVGILGAGIQVVLGVVLSAFLLVGGDNLLRPVKITLQHLFGEKDKEALLDAVAQAVKSVSIGVMGTAFIAAALSWIGFLIAGVPFKFLLAALVFFLVMIQVGPLLVWLPLVIWSASQGHTGMTIFLAVYGVFVLIVDGLLKPFLIGKSGGRLPFLVLFFGVIGGTAAWGFTGMFKGAIIMAISYTVFTSWLEWKENPERG